MMYDLPQSVDIAGREYAIRSDYRAILDIITALNDPDFSAQDRAKAVIAVFYVDPPDISHYEKALECALWFISCGQDDSCNDNKKRPRLVDWNKDFQPIISAVNKVAGREVRADAYCHWWTFVGYYDALDGESTFANIVSIRQKKAKHKKLEKWEQEWYRENKAMVDIGTRDELSTQEIELKKSLRGGKRHAK